jgi:hypothetical protein
MYTIYPNALDEFFTRFLSIRTNGRTSVPVYVCALSGARVHGVQILNRQEVDLFV